MRAETRTRTHEYNVYITADGKEFDTPQEAKKHEAELLLEKKIPRHYIVFDFLDSGYIYKIESEEDLEYLTIHEWDYNAYYTYTGPDWYIAFRHDSGDYPDNYDVFSVKHYLSLLESDVNKLKKIEEEVFDF